MDGQTGGGVSYPTREWLMGRVMVLLSHFYRADEDPEIIRAQAADWYSVLKGFPVYAIDQACRDYLTEERAKPVPGAIVARCRKLMPAPRTNMSDRSLPAPMRPEMTDEKREEAERIVQGLGFTKARWDAVKARPMARSEAELMAEVKADKPHWSEVLPPDAPEFEVLRRARLQNPLMRAAMEAAKSMEQG
jgi:hypothetical protein